MLISLKSAHIFSMKWLAKQNLRSTLPGGFVIASPKPIGYEGAKQLSPVTVEFVVVDNNHTCISKFELTEKNALGVANL